jgi:endonuclease G
MRHPALWIIGLLVIAIATYWLLERFSHASTKPSEERYTSSASLSHSTPNVPENPPSPEEPPDLSTSKPAPPKPTPASPSKKPKALHIESLFSLDHISAQSTLPCEKVRHTYYILCYAEEHEQAAWTAYVLEGGKLRQAHLRRTQDFREDPFIRTQSATLSDYRHSGYDRGHLVPAGDFKWDSVGMSETFYLSNMSPQLHEFNAGIWEAIERTVRTWAQEKGRLVIYTGPVLRPKLKKIGKNVSVPDSFYKVIYALSGKEVQAVAFLVPHRPFPENAVARFMVPVDSVEKVTGINFFPELPDDVEEQAESRWNKAFWPVRFTKR